MPYNKYNKNKANAKSLYNSHIALSANTRVTANANNTYKGPCPVHPSPPWPRPSSQPGGARGTTVPQVKVLHQQLAAQTQRLNLVYC